MSDLSTKTTDELYDRLGELEQALELGATLGEVIDAEFRRLAGVLREIGLIHIELARRTATGWRPL